METGQDDTPSPVPDSPPPPRDHETGMPGGMPSSYPVHRMSVTLTSDDQVQMGLTVYDRRGYMVVKDDESYVTLSGDDQDSTTYPEETFSSTFSGEDPGLHEPEYLHQHLQQQRQQETQSTDRGGHVYSRPVHYGRDHEQGQNCISTYPRHRESITLTSDTALCQVVPSSDRKGSLVVKVLEQPTFSDLDGAYPDDKHVFNEAGEFVAPTVHILISKSGNWTATGGLADSAGVVSPSELDQQLDHEERQHQANNSFPEARVSLTITSQQQQQLAVAKADRRTVMKLTGTEAQGGDSKGQD